MAGRERRKCARAKILSLKGCHKSAQGKRSAALGCPRMGLTSPVRAEQETNRRLVVSPIQGFGRPFDESGPNANWHPTANVSGVVCDDRGNQFRSLSSNEYIGIESSSGRGRNP